LKMQEKHVFKLVRRGSQHSRYDWLNIDCGDARVGRVRCVIADRTLTICSINIFPEFERHGYARATIDMFKEHFDTIIPDRVRQSAIGFWEKTGFTYCEDRNYTYHSRQHSTNPACGKRR
jgi:ribosomal protein S18 acetylase RimI-like enzyme